MELRPYQNEAKSAVFREWENGCNKTLLVLPTGCGKTIVFAKITEECVRNGQRVLILAHRGELLEQAADKIMKTTGLGCATEKAEESCIGSWYRVVPKRLFRYNHHRRGTSLHIRQLQTCIRPLFRGKGAWSHCNTRQGRYEKSRTGF